MNRVRQSSKKKAAPLHNKTAEQNIKERQLAIKNALIYRASDPTSNAPVAMACIMVMPNGQTETILLNIEPEQIKSISQAADNARRKLTDFFAGVEAKKAEVHHIHSHKEAK